MATDDQKGKEEGREGIRVRVSRRHPRAVVKEKARSTAVTTDDARFVEMATTNHVLLLVLV